MIRKLALMALILVGCTRTVQAPPVPLSTEEIQYVSTKTVQVCHSGTGRPIQYVAETGASTGISIDYVRTAAARVGLKIAFVPFRNQELAIQGFQARKCDVLAAVKRIPEREEYIAFTQPYIVFGTTMLVHSLPIQFPMKIGFGRKYSVQATLEKLGKQVQIVPFENDAESYEALERGDVSAIVLDELSAGEIERVHGRKYAHAAVNFQYEISMGVQPENAVLLSILEKALANITIAEKADMYSLNVR